MRLQILVYRPNIKDWPEMSPLTDNILLKVCSKILDPVTTTDELIPSGETSSYRSILWGWQSLLYPEGIRYVGRAKGRELWKQPEEPGAPERSWKQNRLLKVSLQPSVPFPEMKW